MPRVTTSEGSLAQVTSSPLSSPPTAPTPSTSGMPAQSGTPSPKVKPSSAIEQPSRMYLAGFGLRATQVRRRVFRFTA